MPKRMLVDATHPEETRVAVVSGNRLDEFDFETSTKKQLKGNIYLAKVTRVEPSLQAAFVEYGGNRHGFLAFSEIHPDYYRIPIADREALVAETAADARAEERRRDREDEAADPFRDPREDDDTDLAHMGGGREQATDYAEGEGASEAAEAGEGDGEGDGTADAPAAPAAGEGVAAQSHLDAGPAAPIETVGGDDVEEEVGRPPAVRPRRAYKIQEVIKRRQIMLVQVTKEERGNKGAALTTFLSLAGRYCVLMPNTPRGGGISRKIASPKDRKRMKAILDELMIPDGMAVILRTAGMERTRAEIKRDLDYLLRLWDSIRELTLVSTAPTLIHEEANLIKRAIRDLYSKEIDEILVAGDEGYRAAKDFMRMLMPSHAKKVKPYKEEAAPLFHRFQVESQIDAMHSPVVQLKSGGYVVINPTEALVSIDVNSGRATRERNIEETAYKTNLEAAEEIARQLRLRDLAGLIVIDFIDMEEDRHVGAIERRLKDAMRHDRARIQLGRISHFGLLEMSRQRLRPSLVETHFETCAHCGGTGLTRSLSSASLHVLRVIEEEGIRNRAAAIRVMVPTAVALFILNDKREMLAEIEQRYRFRVGVERDDRLIAPDHRLEVMRPRGEGEPGPAPGIDTAQIMAAVDRDAAEDEAAAEAPEDEAPEGEEREDEEREDGEREDGAPAMAAEARQPHGEDGRGRRRRRSRRGGRRHGEDGRGDERRASEPMRAEPMRGEAEGLRMEDEREGPEASEEEPERAFEPAPGAGVDAAEEERQRKRRRRGRRGGRRRAGRRPEEEEAIAPLPYVAPMSAADLIDAHLLDESPPPGPAPSLGGTWEPWEAAAPEAGEAAAAPEAAETPAMPEPPPAEAEPPQKPKRTRRRRPAAGAEPPAAEAAPLRPAAEPPPAEPAPPAAAAGNGGAETVAPAEVESAAEPDGTIPMEVNRPPEKPRRGWWQRLIDG